MKYLFFIILTLSNLFAESKIKFEYQQNKIVQNIAIQDSSRSFLSFKVLCISGYQYLYTVDSKGPGNTVQMFYTPKGQVKQIPQPIKCSGFEETRD